MSVVAVIPARGGSKGIPRKNLQPIEGIPLVGWAVRAGLAAETVSRVIVSTEDQQIAAEARKHEAEVAKRPEELATDTAPTMPAVAHAVEGVEAEIVVTLECTYPLMEPHDIDRAVRKLKDEPDTDIVITACRDHAYQIRPTPSGFEWLSHSMQGKDLRRQDIEPTFQIAGGVYVRRMKDVGRGTSYFGNAQFVEIPRSRSVNIDDPVDLLVARALMADRQHWVVVGSSPSAPQWFARCQQEFPLARTITTNRGCHLFNGHGPDVYHIHDWCACEIHQDDAKRLKGQGARLTTLARSDKRAIRDRHVEWFDEFLQLDKGEYPGRFRKGAYASCGFSGLVCLQYALNHGAKWVHLVGMEGYGEEPQHFQESHKHEEAMTNKWGTTNVIQPVTQSCIDACPDVQFVFYGQLNYEVSGDNVSCVK